MSPFRHPWRIVGYILLGIAILYALDWSVFRIRESRGTGLGTVTVERYMVVSLKGNKVEYNFIGTADVNCARSLFPQYVRPEWTAPCWWRERHRQQWQES